jgi:hypothetical protein
LQLGNKCNHRWRNYDNMVVWVSIRRMHKKNEISLVKQQQCSKILHKNFASHKSHNNYYNMAIIKPAHVIARWHCW